MSGKSIYVRLNVVVLAVLLVAFFLGGLFLGCLEKVQPTCYQCKHKLGQEQYCNTCYTDMVNVAESVPFVEEEWKFSGPGALARVE